MTESDFTACNFFSAVLIIVESYIMYDFATQIGASVARDLYTSLNMIDALGNAGYFLITTGE